MKWVLFTGTWRLVDEQVEKDVRKAVRTVIAHGEGILTGGATGVDYYAMDEAAKLDPTFEHLKVIIPAYLDDYIHDVYMNWCVDPITKADVDALAALLRKMKEVRPESVEEMPYTVITQEHYDLRNIEEVKVAHEVYAFQVNQSTGTQHTIDQANLAGIPIGLHKKYTI